MWMTWKFKSPNVMIVLFFKNPCLFFYFFIIYFDAHNSKRCFHSHFVNLHRELSSFFGTLVSKTSPLEMWNVLEMWSEDSDSNSCILCFLKNLLFIIGTWEKQTQRWAKTTKRSKEDEDRGRKPYMLAQPCLSIFMICVLPKLHYFCYS